MLYLGIDIMLMFYDVISAFGSTEKLGWQCVNVIYNHVCGCYMSWL